MIGPVGARPEPWFGILGSLAVAREMLAAWGETAQVYAALNLGLDYLFLISYSLAIGLACVLLARRIAGRHAWLSQAGILLAWGQDAELARQSLIQFTEYLHEGKYDEAARLYGGPYEVMISHNEDVDPEDRIAFSRRACTINGAQCLRVRSATLQEQISPTEYVFLVEFEYDDGTLFVQGPCCGADETQQPPRSQFPYRVARQPGNDFVVLDMPIYLP